MKLSYTISIHIIKSRRLDISINCCDIPKPINESQAVVTSNGFIGVRAHLAPASIIHAPTGGSIFSQTYPHAVNVTTWEALPQNRVETSIGSQINYEIKNKNKDISSKDNTMQLQIISIQLILT